MNWDELMNRLNEINMKTIYRDRKIKVVRLIKGDSMYCLQIDFEPLEVFNDNNVIAPFREFIKFKEEDDE